MATVRQCLGLFPQFRSICRLNTCNTVCCRQTLFTSAVRQGGGGLVMKAKQPVYENRMVFYTYLGALPVLLFITYQNIVYGDSELADIPEGYEPCEYEYHKTPQRRLLQKYFLTNPPEMYERSLQTVVWRGEQNKWRKLNWKVHQMMREKSDYKAWYFRPGSYQRHLKTRKMLEQEALDNTVPVSVVSREP